MPSRVFYLYLVILLTGVRSYKDNNISKWSLALQSFLKNCPPVSGQSNFFEKFRSCLQRRALINLDTFLEEDVIPIAGGMQLIRFQRENENSTERELQSNEINTGREIDASNLWEIFTNRISRIFRTHALKFDLENLTKSDAVEGRRRHHRRRQGMMMMMMMGLLLMGSVLVPMGFQFLAVLGGKALILAKMALMLSSIQGLKRVATNGVNYGLYHAPVPETWHERSHQEPSPPYIDVPYQHYPPIGRRQSPVFNS